MENNRGAVVGGQQIGAGWTPALSVVKALTVLVEAKRRGLQPVYWLADEDHDRAEVASVVALRGERIIKHRFQFQEPEGTATGWLEWTHEHQMEAQGLWGALPEPTGSVGPLEPTLRGHALALGAALWGRGIRPFSPTVGVNRNDIQPKLELWRDMALEKELCAQADLIESRGETLTLDPRRQSSWFSLDPNTGLRRRLEAGQPCPKGHWLSPGAALRPLMQSLMLPVEAVVLGPNEMAYWSLLERLWDRVGLQKPLLLPRPTAFVLPGGCDISVDFLEALRLGRWDAFAPVTGPSPQKPSAMPHPAPDEAWGKSISGRYLAEIERMKARLKKLDKRLAREMAERGIGMDAEKLRQTLFPFNKPQERVIPGWHWLKDAPLLDRIEKTLEGGGGWPAHQTPLLIH